MKIKTFGWNDNPQTSQIPRIEQAFKDLGCELITDGPCFAIYAHDSSVYDLAIFYKEKFPESLLLLKVLDIPEHCFPDFDLEGLKKKLLKADKILANSEFVKKQIKKYLKLDSKVVLDIPKQVFNRNIEFNKKRCDFFSVGRLRDKNKRGFLIKEIEDETNFFCITAGPEWAGNLNHAGIVSDVQLNELYGNSKFILCMGKNEGIQLQIIEGFLAGSFPLVASDSTTCNEFSPKEFHVEPNTKSIIKKSIEITNNYNFYKKIADEWSIELAKKFHPLQIARNILKATDPF